MRFLLAMIICFSAMDGFDVDPVYGDEPGSSEASDFVNIMQDSAVVSNKGKSPSGAMFRSLVFPGWGQFYNEQYIKSALVFAGQSTLIGLSFYYNKQAKSSVSGSTDEAYYKDQRNLMYWLIGAVVLLSMLDAYIDAHLYDFEAGPDLSMRIGTMSTPLHGQLGLSINARF